MYEINNRVLLIQEQSGLSQAKFSGKLGKSTSFINDIKNNKTKVPESAIKLICVVYNVNEDWLKFGTGEIYKENPIDELAEFDESDPDYPLLKLFSELDQEQREFAMKQLELLLIKQKYEALQRR